MKKNYLLTGLSCEGCVKLVKHALLQCPEIQKADIQLHPPIAFLTLNKPIAQNELQDIISKAGKYTIKELI